MIKKRGRECCKEGRWWAGGGEEDIGGEGGNKGVKNKEMEEVD